MTAEKFHDALTLLSADLVAEADRWRTHPAKTRRWKPYVLLAASFLLVLGCGLFLHAPFFAARSSKQAMLERSNAEAAPAYVEEAADSALQISSEQEGSALPESPAPERSATEAPLPNAVSGSGTLFPGISYLQTLPALLDATATVNLNAAPSAQLFASRADLDNCSTLLSLYDSDNLLSACENYDALWFTSYDLLVLTISALPAHTIPSVTSLEGSADQWHIQLEAVSVPDSTQSDYHILLSVEKGLIPADADITLSLS